MKTTTVYGDLYFQEVAKPRPDRYLANQLRRAHNRIVYGKQKAVEVPVALTEQVAAMSQGKATGKRVVIEPETGFFNGEMRS